MQNPNRILIVEDDADQRALFMLALSSIGYDVLSLSDAEEALARLREDRFHLVLSDWYLPGMMGDELLRVVKQEQPEVLTILMSSHDHVRGTATDSGVDGWFRKNDGIVRLRALVAACLENGRSAGVPPARQ
ncbi:MAG: response regulator [Armatimonadota bacterium]